MAALNLRKKIIVQIVHTFSAGAVVKSIGHQVGDPGTCAAVKHTAVKGVRYLPEEYGRYE